MFTYRVYERPETVEEALALLDKNRRTTLLGGCHFLKMGRKRMSTAIDLGGLGLDQIEEGEERIRIGATVTYGQLEDSDLGRNFCRGIFKETLAKIVSKQLRNTAQVGASVFMKYAFSDFIPLLLAMDAQVELAKAGVQDLEDFLAAGYQKDILLAVLLPKVERKIIYRDIRYNSQDFPALNLAMRADPDLKIVLGARPQRAKVLRKTAQAFVDRDPRIREIALAEAQCGTNAKLSREAREDLFLAILDGGLGEFYDEDHQRQ